MTINFKGNIMQGIAKRERKQVQTLSTINQIVAHREKNVNKGGEKMERQVVTLRLNPKIYTEIKSTAEATGIAMSALITQLLVEKFLKEKTNERINSNQV